jgi:RecA/RadA recombinase
VARKYLIDKVLPSEEVHLIAGPSGGGKTTWLLQMIADWQARKPILGYSSNPVPFVYVACDRSEATMLETLERVGCPDIPLVSLVDGLGARTLEVAIEKARVINSTAEMLFLDGFATLLPSGDHNNYSSVSNFLIRSTRLCKANGLTMEGVMHTAKVKEKEQYLNSRQRIHGSAAWAAFAETIIVIEPVCPEDPANQERSLYLLPRNAPEAKFSFILDSRGRFVEHNIDQEVAFAKLDFMLSKLPPGSPFSTAQAHEWADKQEVGRSTAERWVKATIEAGKIERTTRGNYKKLFTS